MTGNMMNRVPSVGACENVDGRFIQCIPRSDMPHVGFRLVHLSRLKKSERKQLIFAERYYREEITKGSDEAVFLLMLLYASVGEKEALIGLWQWLRDSGDKEYFLGFVAYYLSMISVMDSPLLREVIAFLSPYYEEAKPYFPETGIGVEKRADNTLYEKEVIFRFLDDVFRSGRQTINYSTYTH